MHKQRLTRRLLGRPIPRLIHYCWLGGTEPSEHMRYCIETWRANHPGYEIRRWDESNITHDPFVERAVQGGHWSRASNAIRFRALYDHGGIYLDTDVEVVRSFEPLRRLGCFLSFQYIPDGTPYKPFEVCVGTAVIGARPRHPLLRQLLAEIPNDLQDPDIFQILGPQMTTAVLIRAGLTGYSHDPVRVGGATILPKDAFYPYFYGESFEPEKIGPETFAIHRWAKRW